MSQIARNQDATQELLAAALVIARSPTIRAWLLVTRQVHVSGRDKIASAESPDRPGGQQGRSGFADGASEASDKQGGKRPGQQLQPPAGSGERLAGGAGGGVQWSRIPVLTNGRPRSSPTPT
jgi:hypothetical protein